MRTITSIILHHSLTVDNMLLLDTTAIRRYHIETQHWTDIGYHLVQESVGNEPTLVIGRPWTISGAHAPGRNLDSIGYCIVGNFDLSYPTTATLGFARTNIRWLMNLFHLDRDAIFGHREVTPHRTCPGEHFDLDAFRLSL